MEVTMRSVSAVRSLPTSTLLGLLLGDEVADTLAQRSLVDVFALRSGPPALRESTADYHAIQIIDAAKELMTRALAESTRLGDCLADPATVRDYLRLQLAGLPHEVFMVLLLDSQNRLIDGVELFRGTLSQTSVYPREVVKLALLRNAAAVIFAHNHPSGVAEPSSADEVLTRTLKGALALVDVRVLDHFIVAGTETPLSFAERGLI
jgi:DNA repair protein RadC